MATAKDVEKYSGVFFRLYRMLGKTGETHEMPFEYVKQARAFRQMCYGFGTALERKVRSLGPEGRENDQIGFVELWETHKRFKIKLEGKNLRFVEAATEKNPILAAAEASLEGKDGFEQFTQAPASAVKNELEPEVTGDLMKDIFGDLNLDDVDEL